MIETIDFELIACVINKTQLSAKYVDPANPYKLSQEFGLERIYRFLDSHQQGDKSTHVVIEKRGKAEDDDLELEFRRVCQGHNYLSHPFPLEPVFVDKKINSTGLQLADLMARPIGLSELRPEQPNRAFDVIKKKFRRDMFGNFRGRGLKCFP